LRGKRGDQPLKGIKIMAILVGADTPGTIETEREPGIGFVEMIPLGRENL
jgi:hypothetical protein